MKIILSRKGIDSTSGLPRYGLRWSPILTDGRLMSLPIYRKSEVTCYEDLVLDRNRTYLDLIHQLGYAYPIRTPCHPDPDLYRLVMGRRRGWRPISGHNVPESTHLDNQGVGPGDLFLYFGLFRPTRDDQDDRLPFVGHERHIIFGYLQVDKVISVGPATRLLQWMASHPHSSPKARRDTGNVIYVSRTTTTWNPKLPGAGVFLHSRALELTARGHTKRVWELPGCFRTATISYHSPSSWRGGLFYSACRGQEFVVQDHTGVGNWARRLIDQSARLP